MLVTKRDATREIDSGGRRNERRNWLAGSVWLTNSLAGGDCGPALEQEERLEERGRASGRRGRSIYLISNGILLPCLAAAAAKNIRRSGVHRGQQPNDEQDQQAGKPSAVPEARRNIKETQREKTQEREREEKEKKSRPSAGRGLEGQASRSCSEYCRDSQWSRLISGNKRQLSSKRQDETRQDRTRQDETRCRTRIRRC